MLYISHNCTDPYFNLAVEEYLIKNFDEEIFMLWRNEPSIIVGKNQNTLSEINYEYVRDNSIPVVRRLSGGGAVFHDLGNLNFTFMSNDNKESFNNFRKFTQPILEVLRKLLVNAEFSGRNDLTIDGRKFSGNAQYNYKSRVLHHGTLMFSSVITDMTAALKVKPVKFQGKGVKSVLSRVTNISDHLMQPISITEFRSLIMQHIMEMYDNGKLYELSEEDLNKIKSLVEEKYGTWDWNFGNSPNYGFTNEIKYNGGNIEFHLDVQKGIIASIKIFGDFFGKGEISDIEKVLTGVKHSEEEIRKALSGVDIGYYFAGANMDNLIDGIIKF